MTLKDLVEPERGPLTVTIFGEPGLGKTSLGAEFPNPVFLRTEDGSQAIAHRKDIAMTPLPKGFADIMEFIKDLGAQKKLPFKTLVIDSLTEMEVILTREILEQEKAVSLAVAQGGYGKGYELLASRMGEIRHACYGLQQIHGIHVVFIAHSQTRTEEPPDSDSYGKYTLRLHKKCEGHFVNNVDIVGFLRLRTLVKEKDGRGRAVSTGERVLDVHATPYSCSKNRFGITDSLVYVPGTNPLADYVTKSPKEKDITY